MENPSDSPPTWCSETAVGHFVSVALKGGKTEDDLGASFAPSIDPADLGKHLACEEESFSGCQLPEQ
jgi:hypothetical protein